MQKTLLAVLLLAGSVAHSQTFDEWFNQQETQKKYLLQQIAALKIYADYAEKGYNIASSGLHIIHSLKKGDFDLHNTFLNSLKEINPAIKNWSRVADIIALQVAIVRKTKEALSSVKDKGQLTSGEVNYCASVFSRLLANCLDNIDLIVQLLTAGTLEMKDDERIKRIENIWQDMQQAFSFVSSFGDEMKLLSTQRKSEQVEMDMSRVIDK